MKKQLMFPLAAAVCGAVALVLRLVQNRTGFEAATGLPIPGNPAGIALVVWLVLSAAALFVLTRKLPAETEAPAFPAGFACTDAAALTLAAAGILLMAASGAADLLEGVTQTNLLSVLRTAAHDDGLVYGLARLFPPRQQLLLGALTLAAAAGLLPAVAACRRGSADAKQNLLLLIAPVALVVRLVLVYRADSSNPILAEYYVDLLALMLLTLGFYRLSSFAFGAGSTRAFALYACLALVLCPAALADGGVHLSTLLLHAGGAVALLGFLLLRLKDLKNE